ncbi:TIGR03943 family protein [Anoxybacillus sp. LAT_35]|uniref:TIGR03943 family putative permease subunit n=1 Tax=Anoxybacillus TaxID=150247 RepID=UPI001EDAD2FF|nr:MULTISPECIES: TIGR03943 family protein [Anoxybacillus]MCG5025077.1 TIGR03943 family protein [Anoxybacillus flavithermus]MCG6195959.1 TIGR03943 family protein [Anoxybacillus sp. LAT_38]MCG3083586.1 TIGR03943 family protein [Anoxybacillus sp. LAT27]MCG6170311.1 TIGR03943 family protein [Anoxybacillus sp. LAT_11]MCG6174842.1 TIGR03943 family protein [Anoxybacillus sp. LAT_31]
MIRGVLLCGYALLFIKLLLSGNVTNYIAPKMLPFIYFATFTLLLVGSIKIWMKEEVGGCHHCEGGHHVPRTAGQSIRVYGVFIVPLLIGFMFSNYVLDSSLAAKRGVQLGGREISKENKQIVEQFLEDPEGYMENIDKQIENIMQNQGAEKVKEQEQLKEDLLEAQTVVVNDGNYVSTLNFINEQIDTMIGKRIEITGFVFRERDFTANEFVVARYGLTCCVADATVYGILVKTDEAAKWENDTWVKVEGIIDETTYRERFVPVIINPSVTIVNAPEQPYVYEY